MLYKYVVKNVARAAGYSVTFMPKPLFMDNGSGMHVHQSLWKGGEPLFFDEKGYAGLSDMARWYIGGLLKHAPAILAFSNPTTNSYKRLVPGYEAPVNLVYSQRNRSASVRIPLYSKSPKAKRLEFRCPDPSCNPYLAFSAMLMAGLDGIQNRTEPPTPLDKRPLRPPARRAREGPAGSRLTQRGPRRTARRSRVPAEGRRLHPRRDRHVDRVQDRTRDRPGAAPPAPVGVLPLLRHLIGIPRDPGVEASTAGSVHAFGPRRRRKRQRRQGARSGPRPLDGPRKVKPGSSGSTRTRSPVLDEPHTPLRSHTRCSTSRQIAGARDLGAAS